MTKMVNNTNRYIGRTENSHKDEVNAVRELIVTGSKILDTEAALKRVGGSKVLYTKILKTFIRKHAQDHVQVIRNLEQGDTEAARRVMHSLKGVSQIVGSDGLHNISIEIDLLLVNKQFSALQEMLEDFKKMLLKAINSMQIYLDKIEEKNCPGQKNPTASRKEALRRVEHLADLLKVRDMEATRAGVECIRYLPDLVSTSNIVALQNNLDSLDFNNATFALQSIKQQILVDD